MLKIRMNTKGGKPLILLGLERANLEGLEADPILIDLAEVGLEGHILLLAGEDQQAIIQQIVDAGLALPQALAHYRQPQPGEKIRWLPDGTEEQL